MLYAGLVSVTFRPLSPFAIIDLVRQAGLEAIEWGGDIHVPHGDIPRAREVGRATREAGLKVASYGSYFRLGVSSATGLDFKSVLDSALTLEAPVIRVWAGEKGSDKADADYRKKIADESRVICEQAARVGITIAYEFHGGTLTDTYDSTLALLKDAAHPALRTYWQPRVDDSQAVSERGLKALLPRLSNIHAFYWGPKYERYPLAEGEDVWRNYLTLARDNGNERSVMLEFVRDDQPEAFLEDAAVLKRLVH